jgi:hypothetical protein
MLMASRPSVRPSPGNRGADEEEDEELEEEGDVFTLKLIELGRVTSEYGGGDFEDRDTGEPIFLPDADDGVPISCSCAVDELILSWNLEPPSGVEERRR